MGKLIASRTRADRERSTVGTCFKVPRIRFKAVFLRVGAVLLFLPKTSKWGFYGPLFPNRPAPDKASGGTKGVATAWRRSAKRSADPRSEARMGKLIASRTRADRERSTVV